MHPVVVIMGYSQAAMFLRDPVNTARTNAVLSIVGRREFAVDVPEPCHRLELRFDDIEAPSRTDIIEAARVRLHNREAAERTGMALTPPAPEHAIAIIDFAERIRHIDGVLLCQCQGGISRSPAAALLCLAAWTGPGREQYCVDTVLAARPCAIPHRDLVEFGDEALGRHGALTKALQRERP